MDNQEPNPSIVGYAEDRKHGQLAGGIASDRPISTAVEHYAELRAQEQHENSGGGKRKRVVGRPFLPGVSGNPGGRPKGRTLITVIRKQLRGANMDEAELEAAALAFVAKMKEGSFPHLKEYIDREEGKVPDVVHSDIEGRVDINSAPAFFRRRTQDPGNEFGISR